MATQSQQTPPPEKTRWRNSRRIVMLLNVIQVIALIVFIIAVNSSLLPAVPDNSIIIASFTSWGIIALSAVFALYTAPSFSQERRLHDLFVENEDLQLEQVEIRQELEKLRQERKLEELRLEIEKLQQERQKLQQEREGLKSEKEAINQKN